jgi:hypothetical protein
VVLDHLPLRVKALNAHGRPRPGGSVALDVFCRDGYDNERPVLVEPPGLRLPGDVSHGV